MTVIHIKVIFAIIALLCIIGISIYSSRKEKRKTDLEDDSNSIEVDKKTDSYWESRFNGLKSDYEDREKYHNNRYEQLKSEYEGRESFLREMLDQTRKDYQLMKDELISLQDIKNQLDEKLKQANKKITEYEISLMRLEYRFNNSKSSFSDGNTEVETENQNQT